MGRRRMVSTGWERAELDMFSQFSNPDASCGKVVAGSSVMIQQSHCALPGAPDELELYRAAM